MSYPTRSKGSNYGNNRQRRSPGYGWSKSGKKQQPQETRTRNPITVAKKAFKKRSDLSQSQDLAKVATLAPNLELYLQDPSRYDFPMVDFPKDQQTLLNSLCQATCNSKTKSVDVVVKDTQAGKSKRLRIVSKDNEKAELSKVSSELESEAVKSGRVLPSQQEIFDRAVEIWRRENGYLEGVANPNRTELQEEGFLNRAKVELMTSESGEGERAIDDYVTRARSELERLGYSVVPMSASELGAVGIDSVAEENKWADYLASQ